MKLVPLTKNISAIVDDEDFDLISKYKWCASDGRGGKYRAVTRTKDKIIVMHRMILGIDDRSVFIDHINGNSVDNRRENLRICNQFQNSKNLKINRNVTKTSKYKGVCKSKGQKYFTAQLTFNYKKIHLGCFDNEEEAKDAYNKAALAYFGEFARLNL